MYVKAAGRSSEVSWITLDSMYWDPHFKVIPSSRDIM